MSWKKFNEWMNEPCMYFEYDDGKGDNNHQLENDIKRIKSAMVQLAKENEELRLELKKKPKEIETKCYQIE